MSLNLRGPSSPTTPPVEPPRVVASPSPDAAPPPVGPDAALAPPPSTVQPPTVVLRYSACRASTEVVTIEVEDNGRFKVVIGDQPGRPGTLDPERVRALSDRIVAAGIESWGDARCDPADPARRCSMHPCYVSLATTTVDGHTYQASRSDDAPGDPVPFADAVAGVGAAVELWQWFDPGVAAGDASCHESTDCTIAADSCKGLHAVGLAFRGTVDAPHSCTRPVAPREAVAPVCVDSRCALAAVTDLDTRGCKRTSDCSPVRYACSGYGAVRKDRVREIAIRNDHTRCGGSASPGPVPPVACLRGVCVLR